MKDAQINEVKFNKGYIKEKFMLNLNTTLDAVWTQFQKTGRIGAFSCNWKEGMENKPHIFWDSDVAKWMESAAYAIAYEDNPELRDKIEFLVDEIEKNQGDDGYFNIYFTVCEPDKRFTDRGAHELYCAGHLIEAACAYYECCGEIRFLNLMKKFADYIRQVFVIDKSASFYTPGHEEIELALIRLYRVTNEKKYLDLAVHFINLRGTADEGHGSAQILPIYDQSHAPVRGQREAVGHCVRALYLYCAMADCAKELDDQELMFSCKALFDDIVNYKMYITGGLGQNHTGESFTVKYDLKNNVSYTETCASIAMMMFAHRMFELDHSSKYADIIERELYNGMMSGVSLDGNRFFYTNPLEIRKIDRDRRATGWKENFDWLPITQRPAVFECSCCPPNITRTIASITQYIYSVSDKNVYINQFADSVFDNGEITVIAETDYPKTGKLNVKSEGAEYIYIRIPGWCEKFEISVPYEMVDGYAKVKGGQVEIHFDMTPQYMMSNENVKENENKIAVMRGPVVYCVEAVDNGALLHKLYVDTSAKPKCEDDDFFGLKTIIVDGFKRKTSSALYCKLSDEFEKTEIKFIPYCGFANRGESDMRVWVNYK